MRPSIINKFFLLLLIFYLPISAQSTQLQFKHLTPDDGLSSSTVTCFLKDYKGFMWVGTYYGLNRYDGYQFKVYNNNSTDSTSISHNLVYDIFEDSKKNLWIGTQDGLSLYDQHKDKFINFMQTKSSSLFGLNCNVLNVIEDSYSNFWLATDQGLIKFNYKNNSVVTYKHDPLNPRSLSYYNVERVFIDSKKRIWVSTRRGLNLFQPETNTFLHVSFNGEKSREFSDTYFTDIVEDREGNVWFGTFGSGIYCLDSNTDDINKLISFRHNDNNNSSSLSADRILSLLVDKQGNLWVGVENGGLNFFDRKTKSFSKYRANEFDPNSLNNESIHALYQDELENLWIGTFAGGINVSKYNSGAILGYTYLPGIISSLSNNSVTCCLEDHLGRKFIGTDGGGLNLFDAKTGKFSHFNSKNTNLSSDALLAIVEDNDHQIWLGTWGGGLVRFDINNRSFQSFNKNNSAIPDNNIFTIVVDKKGDLWLGSFQNGLIHYNKKRNSFKNYTSKNSNLSISMITVIKQLSDGRFLIGTPSGLNVFQPAEELFKTYFHNPENKNSISSNGIHTIEIENDTSIWIGTDKGLNRFNPNTESFSHYLKEDGLPDNVIKGLAIDLSGKLWVSTNNGISRFDIRKKEFKIFTKSEGLQGNEFNDRSALRLSDGKILLGGTKGFNLINPDKIKENKNIPRILITDFQVFNKSMGVGTEDSPLEKHISETKELTLSYQHSVITFQFASMDFTVPEKNQYAYMMEGFENEWNYVGSNRSATYTNLDPGKYVFRVKASNNDGVWNKAGISLNITITPPFWKAIWFRVLFISLIFGLLIAGYKIRTARMSVRNRELEKHVSERTSQLEAAIKELEAFSYSISHDLRAPLRAIDGYSKMFLEDFGYGINDEGKRLLEVIRNSSKKMGNLINDLLEFSRVGRSELRQQLIDMEGLVNSAFNELMDNSIRVKYDIVIHPLPTISGDQNLIRQVWVNLISNAIKFSSKREFPKIEIGCKESEKEKTYFVIDNGAGFEQQYVHKLFGVFRRLHKEEEFVGTGVGLAIVQRIIQRHSGRVWAKGEIEKGASFYFSLPYSGIQS